jgi:hypothetical protein
VRPVASRDALLQAMTKFSDFLPPDLGSCKWQTPPFRRADFFEQELVIQYTAAEFGVREFRVRVWLDSSLFKFQLLAMENGCAVQELAEDDYVWYTVRTARQPLVEFFKDNWQCMETGNPNTETAERHTKMEKKIAQIFEDAFRTVGHE